MNSITRRKCLEISGLPLSIQDSQREGIFANFRENGLQSGSSQSQGL